MGILKHSTGMTYLFSVSTFRDIYFLLLKYEHNSEYNYLGETVTFRSFINERRSNSCMLTNSTNANAKLINAVSLTKEICNSTHCTIQQFNSSAAEMMWNIVRNNLDGFRLYRSGNRVHSKDEERCSPMV